MIFQSHWSKPTRWTTQNKSVADMLFMYAASADSLKKAFNMPVAMVTDSDFASMLNGLPLPYDLITTELDGLRADPRWWASAKFHIFKTYAPQHPKLYQMDTDVFFWQPTTVGDHVGLVVQSVEQDEVFSHSYAAPVRFFESKFRQMGLSREQTWPWRPDLTSAFNCGVVGFGRPVDAVEYATMAEEICRLMTPFLDEFMLIPPKSRQGTPMVIPEQYFLRCFAQDRNLYTAYVCTKMISGKLAYYDPDDYYHAMADKNNPETRNRFREMVQASRPDLYREILRRFS